jgi:acylglycerol lipase
MSISGNSLATYRFRISRGVRDQSGASEQARPWADVGADPRARMRCGSFFASDGAEVPYRLWTAREPTAAVLLLHGAFDYAAAFDEIGPKLARKKFTALAIDQRGFGATKSRGTWSGAAHMANDAGDAARVLLERIGTDKPLFVLGESIGGAVAIHAAAVGAIPQLRGIVLAAPGALASRFRHRLLAWIAAAARLLAGDSELVFERLSGWELTPAAAIRLIVAPLVMRRITPDMLCGMADLALSAVEAASGVEAPVLTMVGARDELVRLACVRRLFDNLAGEKTWRVIPEAPHLMLHSRHSNEILREAVNWMTAQVARPDDDRKAEVLAVAGNPCSAGARLG